MRVKVGAMALTVIPYLPHSQANCLVVSLNSFCTSALRLNGAGYDPKKLEAYMQALSARANGLGYRYITKLSMFHSP